MNGDRRTAWIAMRMMLRLNGVRLNAPVDEAGVLVNAVAMGELEVPEIARQLQAWAVG